jgi:hypothetical protein
MRFRKRASVKNECLVRSVEALETVMEIDELI